MLSSIVRFSRAHSGGEAQERTDDCEVPQEITSLTTSKLGLNFDEIKLCTSFTQKVLYLDWLV